jgi:hypothetical protein
VLVSQRATGREPLGGDRKRAVRGRAEEGAQRVPGSRQNGPAHLHAHPATALERLSSNGFVTALYRLSIAHLERHPPQQLRAQPYVQRPPALRGVQMLDGLCGRAALALPRLKERVERVVGGCESGPRPAPSERKGCKLVTTDLASVL